MDQVYIATCGIPQQILLPADLINDPQSEPLGLRVVLYRVLFAGDFTC